MTGPIVFSNPVAREQLEEEGEVVTFRSSERTTGETWYRSSRTGPKLGDVVVELERTVPEWGVAWLSDKTIQLSGFGSAAEWEAAIAELHGEPGQAGYLYHVELIGGGDA